MLFLFQMWAMLLLCLASPTPAGGILNLDLRGNLRDQAGRTDDGLSGLAARDEDLQVELANAYVCYTADISIGTPAQHINVIVDTGSSDLWVPQQGAVQNCRGRSNIAAPEVLNCSAPIFFNSKQSSSFHEGSDNFHLRYGDGSTASGNWAQDTVTIGGATLANMTMAAVAETNATQGILGIGLPGTEATVRTITNGQPNQIYPNLPVLLKNHGYIDRLVYSLWLNSPTSREGSLLFGAVDHAKYDGGLSLVPLVRTYQTNDPLTLSIMLHGISASVSDAKSFSPAVNCSLPVLLDSGSTLNYLPGPFIEAIARAINATWDERLLAFTLPCDTPGALQFDLSGTTIRMALKDAFIELVQTDGGGRNYVKGSTGECALAFQPSAETFILGDAFLRAAYVIYDLENYEVGIAQAVFNSTSTRVEQVSRDIPSATQAPNYSSTSSTEAFTTFGSATGTPVMPTGVSLTSITALPTGLGAGSLDHAQVHASKSASSSTNAGSSTKLGAVSALFVLAYLASLF